MTGVIPYTTFVEVINMKIINATKARDQLFNLIDETSMTHEPIYITGKRKRAVLVSEEDWKSIEETMYLLSIPGMRESIQKGLAEPLSECKEDIDW